MDANEIEQCRREWEPSQTMTGYAQDSAELLLYRRWFYQLLTHARVGLAEKSGAAPLPGQYARSDGGAAVNRDPV